MTRLSKSGTKAVEKYITELMPESIETLVDQARKDLYHGPGQWDEDDDGPRYPGFAKATKKIASWWSDEVGTGDFYLDTQTDTVLDESAWSKEQDFHEKEWKREYKAALAEAESQLADDEEIDEDEFLREFGEYDESWMSEWLTIRNRDAKQLVFGELAEYIT